MWQMAETIYVDRVLVGKPEGKRVLEGPRPVWEDNVTTDLKVKGLEAVDWMYLAEGRYK